MYKSVLFQWDLIGRDVFYLIYEIIWFFQKFVIAELYCMPTHWMEIMCIFGCLKYDLGCLKQYRRVIMLSPKYVLKEIQELKALELNEKNCVMVTKL